ncbi:aspartate-semialdehyde dehydrogenase [Pasteuria penetrans]|uniref:aspartate-semialdehyde dehydrogenase n=1 Tax=Pasteuria penetrans TaxID=86005 RepID=UPI000FAF561E|nr:aspartate-semialdehyde dehydrogenase [Pasteuria penetrans]
MRRRATKRDYPTVAIVGATGAVGKLLVKILQERSFPVKTLRPLASPRSAGEKIGFAGQTYTVGELGGDSFTGVDIAFFSAGGAVSQQFVPRAVDSGALVVDNTSVFRQSPLVPLVVPEVNPDAVGREDSLIANPNCSTAQMVVALYPLHKRFGLKRILVSTYQAVSGAGDKALAEYRQQQAAVLRRESPVARVLPVAGSGHYHPIVDNALPQIDVSMENGYTKEEMKMIWETRKIFSLPQLPVTATCVRLPIAHGHSEAVYVELVQPFTLEAIREVLYNAPGVVVEDDLVSYSYPTPYRACGDDAVHVGRLRRDLDHPQGLHLWIVSDNLRKGAATNAVQIAELWLQKQQEDGS